MEKVRIKVDKELSELIRSKQDKSSFLEALNQYYDIMVNNKGNGYVKIGAAIALERYNTLMTNKESYKRNSHVRRTFTLDVQKLDKLAEKCNMSRSDFFNFFLRSYKYTLEKKYTISLLGMYEQMGKQAIQSSKTFDSVYDKYYFTNHKRKRRVGKRKFNGRDIPVKIKFIKIRENK